jgi:hypothetical protein
VVRTLTAVIAALLVAAPVAQAAPPPRKGGPIRRVHYVPKNPLARFLARQVGPTAPRKKVAKAADAGSTLYLARSYDIPVGDPSATRLANLSWTYDSAVAAVAFDSYGAHLAAQQLLDQLAALQRTDGSIDYAYDVSTGKSTQLFRTGTIAWVAYAMQLHREATGTTRYDDTIYGLTKWLIARRQPHGLLAGGPDVSWASTQNNEIAYLFFANLAGDPVGNFTNGQLSAVARKIAGGIDSQLQITPAAGQLGYVEGTDDQLRPLDAQTLGVMYLMSQGRVSDAQKVRAYIDAALRVTGRSIVKSGATATYNMTYAAAGPFSGYKPYASGGPDVLWEEGTAQADLASVMLGQDHSAQDAALLAWSANGPLQADKTVTDSKVNEYHVWPASAAASWMLLATQGFPR